MRIRILGFGFKKDRAPKAVGVKEVYESLRARTNFDSEAQLRCGVTTYSIQMQDGSSQDWWLGAVLKVRDTKRFTKLTETDDGKRRMTAELLAGKDALAEVNFFLSHPVTGSGLFAHYHQSASLNGDLRCIFRDEFKYVQDNALRNLLEARLPNAAHNKAMKEIRGFLPFTDLVLEADFLRLVGSMRRVDVVKINLSTIMNYRNLFGGYRWTPKSETLFYRMPEWAASQEIAEELERFIGEGEAEHVSVKGLDQDGRERSFSKNRNPYILSEFDYDEAMDGFQLDFDDYERSLRTSKVARELTRLVQNPEIRQLLERT